MSVSSRTVLHYLTGAIRCSRKVLIKGKINNIRATSTRQEVALHLFEVGIMGLLKLPRLCLEVWTSCHESLTSNKPRHLRTPPRRWFTGPSEVCVFIIPQQALPSCREDLFLSWAISFKMEAVSLLLKAQFRSLRRSPTVFLLEFQILIYFYFIKNNQISFSENIFFLTSVYELSSSCILLGKFFASLMDIYN